MDDADYQHLRTAEGWLDLGLHADAMNEVELVTAAGRKEPVALILRWRIHAAAREWETCVTLGRLLVDMAPDEAFGWVHRSYALHELKQTREAADLLKPALDKFPDEDLIPYNLACYACQLGNLDEAEALLRTAMRRGDPKEIKERALNDTDLTPLKDRIPTLRA